MMKAGWAAVAALLLMACGSQGSTLSGTMTVIESLPLQQSGSIGAGCTGVGGYDDLSAGTAVVVKDEGGKVLATGSLDSGKISALETCQWSFTVSNVPDAKFYQIEVSHRGAVTYSKADLDKAGWKVQLRLG